MDNRWWQFFVGECQRHYHPILSIHLGRRGRDQASDQLREWQYVLGCSFAGIDLGEMSTIERRKREVAKKSVH